MADPVSDPPPSLVERLTAEGLIPMSAASRLYGSGRGATPTHKSTVARHALHGVRLADGRVLKLEAIRVAGRLMTTEAAVLRFFEMQNENPVGSDTTPPADPPRSPHQRSKASAKAAAELDKLGVK